jgi:transcriptional regulator with XRE-family HTH domain
VRALVRDGAGQRASIRRAEWRAGASLRELREERELSQEKLAEMVNLHRNYVGVLERGGQFASLDAICKLAHALKIKPADLLKTLP